MGKSTISMAIFNSFLFVYQRGKPTTKPEKPQNAVGHTIEHWAALPFFQPLKVWNWLPYLTKKKQSPWHPRRIGGSHPNGGLVKKWGVPHFSSMLIGFPIQKPSSYWVTPHLSPSQLIHHVRACFQAPTLHQCHIDVPHRLQQKPRNPLASLSAQASSIYLDAETRHKGINRSIPGTWTWYWHVVEVKKQGAPNHFRGYKLPNICLTSTNMAWWIYPLKHLGSRLLISEIKTTCYFFHIALQWVHICCGGMDPNLGRMQNEKVIEQTSQKKML